MPNNRADAYFLELAPGSSERQGSSLAADIAAADVLALSDFSQNKSMQLFPYLTRGSNHANQTVQREFCHIDRLPGYSTFPAIQLYRACGEAHVDS